MRAKKASGLDNQVTCSEHVIFEGRELHRNVRSLYSFMVEKSCALGGWGLAGICGTAQVVLEKGKQLRN